MSENEKRDMLPGEMIDQLILNGGLEVAGVDEKTGELLYSFTEELERVNPELFSRLENLFYLEIMELWERGFLDVSLLSDQPMVSITKKALSEEVEDLPDNLSMTLNNVIAAMRRFDLEE
jgi:hypothetical protein